jgi:hypothetical protein
MPSILHLMSTGGIARHLSGFAAGVLDALERAHPELRVVPPDLAKNPPGHVDGDVPVPLREHNKAQCEGSLIPEPRDNGGVHVLVSF